MPLSRALTYQRTSQLSVSCIIEITVTTVQVNASCWMLGDVLCDAWVAFDVMCCTASILNLTSISVDRSGRQSRRYVLTAVTIAFELSVSLRKFPKI